LINLEQAKTFLGSNAVGNFAELSSFVRESEFSRLSSLYSGVLFSLLFRPGPVIPPDLAHLQLDGSVRFAIKPRAARLSAAFGR
jgi:hypothetical protein